MAADRPPAPPSPAGGPTATWGTQHFDRAPTGEELVGNSTAGSTQKPPTTPSVAQDGQPSVSEAVKSIRATDFLNVYQAPCARQGFMTGIGGGAAVGILRYILGAPVPKAANWAVGAFALGGIVSFEVCQAARRAERNKMKRAVEVYDRKHAEVRQREAEKAAEKAAAQAVDEERRRRQQEEAASRRWYKFW